MIQQIITEYMLMATIILIVMITIYIGDIIKKRDNWKISNIPIVILFAILWPISMIYVIVRPMITEKKLNLKLCLNLIIWILLMILVFCNMITD